MVCPQYKKEARNSDLSHKHRPSPPSPKTDILLSNSSGRQGIRPMRLPFTARQHPKLPHTSQCWLVLAGVSGPPTPQGGGACLATAWSLAAPWAFLGLKPSRKGAETQCCRLAVRCWLVIPGV